MRILIAGHGGERGLRFLDGRRAVVAPQLVELAIAHDHKEPGEHVHIRPPAIDLGSRAGQAFLYEVVGAIGVAHEEPGITPKPRNFGFDELDCRSQEATSCRSAVRAVQADLSGDIYKTLEMRKQRFRVSNSTIVSSRKSLL